MGTEFFAGDHISVKWNYSRLPSRSVGPSAAFEMIETTRVEGEGGGGATSCAARAYDGGAREGTSCACARRFILSACVVSLPSLLSE